MVGKRRMLALAVTRRSATAVEVAVAKGAARVLRAAEFVFPDEIGDDEPDRLGKALKEFLRQGGFSASRCVIGLEAARLTSREKRMPKGSGDSVAQILTIAVEREFASDRNELVFDYVSGTGPDGEPSVLLMAAPRRSVDHLVAMAQAAGLTATAMTSSTMALADSANGLLLADRLVLHVFRGGIELAARSPAGHLTVWRLSASPPDGPQADPTGAGTWLDDLAHELRRIVYMSLGDAGAGQTRELLVWNETGPAPEAWDALGRRLDMPVRLCASEDSHRPEVGDAPPAGGQYSAAAAMALAGLKGRALPVDFLHSRLTPPKTLALRRKVAWGVAASAVALLAGAAFVFDLICDEWEVADMEARLAANAESLAEAENLVAKAAFARPWYRREPRRLECLRQVTLTFPAEGGIWTTSLSMQEDLRGVISGKATTKARVLDVLDRLKANPRFADVKPLYLREAGRGGRDVAFAMTFHYTGSDGP